MPAWRRGSLDKEIARGRGPRAERAENQRGIDAVAKGLIGDPLVGPRRIVELLVHADGAAGQSAQRVVEPIADVTVAEGEIHGPNEDRAVRFFEGSVEFRFVPKAGPDPHETQAFLLAGGNAAVDARADFITKCTGMIDGPRRSAHPLGGHDVGHLFVHAHGNTRRVANERADLVEDLFLAVDALHEFAKALDIEARARDALKRSDEAPELSHHEVEPMTFEETFQRLRLAATSGEEARSRRERREQQIPRRRPAPMWRRCAECSRK